MGLHARQSPRRVSRSFSSLASRSREAASTLFQGLALDFGLGDPALDLVDLHRHGMSISMRSLEAHSSIRSMALSGRKRSVM
jgi:hypothetical protein